MANNSETGIMNILTPEIKTNIYKTYHSYSKCVIQQENRCELMIINQFHLRHVTKDGLLNIAIKPQFIRHT